MSTTPRAPARSAFAMIVRRLPNQFRGRTRLVNAILDHVPARKPMAVAQMKLGYRMEVDLRSRTEVLAYYLGDYDTPLIRSASALMPPGGVALDVGGNIGFWSVPLARRGQVHVVEPVPTNADRIRRNAELNGVSDSLTLHRVAASDVPSTLVLTLREDFGRGASTGNAAVQIADGDDARFESIEVPAVTIDNLMQTVERLDVVKLDIEGHEDFALLGARETLRRCRPVMFVELNHDYYRRRGVTGAERFAVALDGLDYAYARRDGQRWVEVPTFDSPHPIDDLVLVPRERLDEVLATLRSG